MKRVTVREITDWLNTVAPFDTAEDFDNVGLLLGDPGAEVHTLLFGLDATPELAREAVSLGAELVVTHHPLIFHPLRHIDYTTPQGQAVVALVRNGVSLLSAHTNWDKAPGGVCDALAEALGLANVQRADDYMRLGTLPGPLERADMTRLIETALRVTPKVYGGGQRFFSVAAAGGAYGEGAADAALRGADAYVVGEIRHHELLDACARGLTVFEAGHYATEAPGIAALYQRFLRDAASASWQTAAHLFDCAPYPGALR